MEYDFLVYIGRFQPFHNGHKSVIDKALQLSRRVIVLIGSAGEPRTLRNPWTYEERESLIYAHYSLNNPFRGRIDLQPVVNRKYDHEWISMVKKAVDNVTWNYRTDQPQKIGLIGHMKDDTDYLRWFPEWPLTTLDPSVIVNATEIRDRFFGIDTTVVPEETAEMLFKLKMGMK